MNEQQKLQSSNTISENINKSLPKSQKKLQNEQLEGKNEEQIVNRFLSI